MTKAQKDRIVKAAMRFFRKYEDFYYEYGRRDDSGYALIRACAAAKRGKK